MAIAYDWNITENTEEGTFQILLNNEELARTETFNEALKEMQKLQEEVNFNYGLQEYDYAQAEEY